MQNLNLLESLLVLEREGSVGAAAKELCLSQPALSHQLKQLEESLGHKLFVKQAGRIVLTDKGRSALEYARRLVALRHELAAEFEDESPDKVSQLRFGMSTQLQAALFADILVEQQHYAAEKHPKIILKMLPDSEISSRIRQRVVDLALTSSSPLDPQVKILAHVEMPVVLVIGGKVEPALRKQLGEMALAGNWSELARFAARHDLDFCFPSSGFRLRDEADRFIKEVGFTPRIGLDTQALGTMIVSAMYHRTMAFLPICYVPKHAHNNPATLVGPPDGFWRHHAWLVGPTEYEEGSRGAIARGIAKTLALLNFTAGMCQRVADGAGPAR